jgi:hypothetical protein
MRDFMTKTAFLDGATKHLFKIEPESLEQRRHFVLNAHHVGDWGVTATAVLGSESKGLHRSPPVNRVVGPMP